MERLFHQYADMKTYGDVSGAKDVPTTDGCVYSLPQKSFESFETPYDFRRWWVQGQGSEAQ